MVPLNNDVTAVARPQARELDRHGRVAIFAMRRHGRAPLGLARPIAHAVPDHHAALVCEVRRLRRDVVGIIRGAVHAIAVLVVWRALVGGAIRDRMARVSDAWEAPPAGQHSRASTKRARTCVAR